MKVCISLPENVSAPLATIAPASVVDGATQWKMRGWEFARAGKEITWVIFNDGIDDISLETLVVSMDRVSEITKHEI